MRNATVAFVVGGKAYIGCGFGTTPLGDLWEYDVESDNWTWKSDFPADGRSRLIAFGLRGDGYIGLGSTSRSKSYYNDLWRYDNETDTWKGAAQFPGVGRTQTGVFTINGSAFVGCGLETSQGLGLNDFSEFIPE
ncbi:hypothetical protein JMN32_18605 [Fulvivirga sp. 29W222]|uniref:Galactose oxidase n=1 Tax=Fulvivirga marina TaxID=2494733 RepID=A0A937G4L0_9BACT|nr:hypothetical protein [Fulvivirga marina]MBL6448331.1 hypothetical protein [Fulvivirga marina]